jgi:DNA-3-methyladenine glycosylase II
MTTSRSFTITPRGAFSLAESVGFGFGQRHREQFSGTMRMAFVLDGYRQQVGVALVQDDAGVHGTVQGVDEVEPVRRQVARVLSLDHDGETFAEIGRRDPVIGRLQAVAPGLRPPLFYSPYEAAVWAVLSVRRSGRQATDLRDRLSRAHGRTFEVAGRTLPALPTPRQMLEVDAFDGVEAARLHRLHGVARAALEGQLAAERLVAVSPEVATAGLRQIPGIGPFYSELILIRASGAADVLPRDEPMVLDLVQRLYRLPRRPDPQEFGQIAQAWRPLRTWAVVLIRAASSRLDAPMPAGAAPARC